MEKEMITITREEYDKLKEDQKFLQALRASGVDDWEWYDAAIDYLEDTQDEED